jgi:uncharacterized protein
MLNLLRAFLVRDDPEYQAFVDKYQARSLEAKAFYLFMHLVPGLLLYLLINMPPVYRFALHTTGLNDTMLQGWSLLAIVFLWHLAVPLLSLRWIDKLTFRESIAFLSLRQFDTKGFFVVMPLVFVVGTLCTLPYLKYLFPVVSDRIAAIPALNPPVYSIFRDPTVFYGLFPAWFLAIGFVGNFLCEELYFHGYLMKKIGYLGPWAWVVNSLLFGLYHVWQAPTTWALIGPVFLFGLLMQWRKNLYPLIAFHFLVNIIWSAILGALT